MQESAAVSLAEAAYQVLRDRLVMLDIRPGDPLNDAQLAADLGFGRTPVREALKRLEVDRLVVAYPRRGTFATAVDITELADISEIRTLLEPLAARRAAMMAGDGIRAEIRDTAQAITGLDPDGGQRALLRFDVGVHRLIYRAAGNPHLTDTLVRYDNLATRIWCLVLDRLPPVTAHVTEHVELLEAIADGDADRAADLAGAHVSRFGEAIRAAL
jgi:DNA-binding GntR family transcriptional regulator